VGVGVVEIKALFIPSGYQRLCIIRDRQLGISHRHVWRSTHANRGFITTDASHGLS